MAIKFTPQNIKTLPGPAPGRDQVIHRDSATPGLALRVTKAGFRAWVLHYSARGISRRLTIGSVEDWPLALVRQETLRLNRLVDQGRDPLAEREAERTAPTVVDLVERWRETIADKKRERSRREDESLLAQWVLPALGKDLVAEVKRADIERLHHKISKSGTLVRANRTLALLSRLFNLAIGWEMRPDNVNPARGIEKNHEEPRHRHLKLDELDRFVAALPNLRNRQAADVIKLLMLTGARRSEVLHMQWSELDLGGAVGIWTKPASATKQKRVHQIPLNNLAREWLLDIKAEAEELAQKHNRPMSRWVFPQRGAKDRPLGDVKNSWARLCEKAGIEDFHLHDLRHVYGTYLASSGVNLLHVGALLGHQQITTTQRYSHALMDPLREATERVGALITSIETGKTGEVVPMRRRRPGSPA